MASRSSALDVAVTNDLERRVPEHKPGVVPGFTSRFRINRLVYFGNSARIEDAIARSKKIGLIESTNPEWEDLSEGWEPNPSC